jgi:hypothetical protein
MPPRRGRGPPAAAKPPSRGRFAVLTGLAGDELERSEDAGDADNDLALVNPPPTPGSGGAPECRGWADLPAALVRMVCACALLDGSDALRMRGACRGWRRALPTERDCWRRLVHSPQMAGPWGSERVAVPFEALTQARAAQFARTRPTLLAPCRVSVSISVSTL